jgi:uncharacterized membrane protein YphA (DoxX/SURF4 family)
LRASRVLAIIVLIDALFMALGHAPLALGVSSLFRPSRPPPSPRGSSGSPPGGGGFPFIGIGAYFLFALIVYILGGILVASGRLFKLANWGLIVMAVVDNILLIYTRSMPNIFFRRVIPWSWEWFPVGTVQILIGQALIVVLCLILLYKPDSTKREATSSRQL